MARTPESSDSCTTTSALWQGLIRLSGAQAARRLTGFAFFLLGSATVGSSFAGEAATILAVNQLAYCIASLGLGYGILSSAIEDRPTNRLAASINVIFGIAVQLAFSPLWLSAVDEVQVWIAIAAGLIILSSQQWQEVRVAQLERSRNYTSSSALIIVSGVTGLAASLSTIWVGNSATVTLAYLLGTELVCALLAERAVRATHRQVIGDAAGNRVPVQTRIGSVAKLARRGWSMSLETNLNSAAGQLEILTVVAMLAAGPASGYVLWSKLLAIPVYAVSSIIPRLILPETTRGVNSTTLRGRFFVVYGAAGTLAIVVAVIAVLLLRPSLPSALSPLSLMSATMLIALAVGTLGRWIAPVAAAQNTALRSPLIATVLAVTRGGVGIGWIGFCYYILESSAAVLLWPIIGVVAACVVRYIASLGELAS